MPKLKSSNEVISYERDRERDGDGDECTGMNDGENGLYTSSDQSLAASCFFGLQTPILTQRWRCLSLKNVSIVDQRSFQTIAHLSVLVSRATNQDTHTHKHTYITYMSLADH